MKWCNYCQRHYDAPGPFCPECGRELWDNHPNSPAGRVTEEQIRAQRAAAYRAAHPGSPAPSYRSTNSGVFSHPGEQLKTTGKVIFWAICAVALLLALVVYSAAGFLAAVLVAGIGFVVAWLSSITTYAFGSLLDDVEEIKEHLRGEPRYNQPPRAYSTPSAPQKSASPTGKPTWMK